jgi:hypothetical protein
MAFEGSRELLNVVQYRKLAAKKKQHCHESKEEKATTQA